eukprot:5113302-Karenia_brevis.AAC.1
MIPMSDMVYQGTVLGPVLWNTFFGSVYRPIREFGFDALVFADDLNAFRFVPNTFEDDLGYALLSDVSDIIHDWGYVNQVAFDPSKESCHILSCRGGDDTVLFKYLGIWFDVHLSMRH